MRQLKREERKTFADSSIVQQCWRKTSFCVHVLHRYSSCLSATERNKLRNEDDWSDWSTAKLAQLMESKAENLLCRSMVRLVCEKSVGRINRRMATMLHFVWLWESSSCSRREEEQGAHWTKNRQNLRFSEQTELKWSAKDSVEKLFDWRSCKQSIDACGAKVRGEFRCWSLVDEMSPNSLLFRRSGQRRCVPSVCPVEMVCLSSSSRRILWWWKLFVETVWLCSMDLSMICWRKRIMRPFIGANRRAYLKIFDGEIAENYLSRSCLM